MQSIMRRLADSGILQSFVTQTSIAHLPREKFLEIPIPLPPIAEQQAIAEALSDADALIESLEQLLAKKRQIKQGAMQDLLTGHRRLPGFSGAWEVKRLGEICRIGMGRTPSRLKSEYWGHGYKWLSIADLKSKVVSDSKEEITDLAASEMSVIPKGTLLMSFKLSIGRLCFAGCDLYTNEAICSFNDLRANASFLYYYLGRVDFSLYGKLAVKGYTLNKASLHQVEVALPSVEEQAAIASVLTTMDDDITALESKLQKARQIKQGMMQELLTGRIRLVSSSPAMALQVNTPPQAAPVEASPPKAHNWQFNEAVVLGVLAKLYGSDAHPLARVRRTKMAYLFHRHAEGVAEGYLKKAAGPYNPNVRYGGPEKIAIQQGYVAEHNNGTYPGLVPGEKVSQAEAYFEKWYGPEAHKWLLRLKYKKTEELELLATVDMAMEELKREGRMVRWQDVKQIIKDHPEWQAKLERPIFSDDNIQRAIPECEDLLA
jgi:type I restriction enzyme S subunit